MVEVARRMREVGRVLVFDVDYSSTKYHVYLGNRASRHAYYLRPPEGVVAADLKRILDEAGGESEFEFRYYVYPELETDLKPLLTADPYAGKHFGSNPEQKYLQIEGERRKAREKIAELLDGLKEPFDPESFPRLHEFVLRSFTSSAEGRPAEMVLLRKDLERDELRKSEPGFHVALAEHGLAREVDVYRPTVNDTEPAFTLYSNEHTSAFGHAFLADMAAYFGSAAYVQRSELESKARESVKKEAAAVASHPTHQIPRAPQIEAPKLDERQLVTKVVKGIRELAPTMKLLRKREISQSGPYITIAFPGLLGFGKGPSQDEMKEIEAIYRALKGDPSFGSDWYAHYQVERGTGEVKILAGFEASAPKGWTSIGRH